MHLETTNCWDPIRKVRQFRSVGNMKPCLKCGICLNFMSFYLIVAKKKKKACLLKCSKKDLFLLLASCLYIVWEGGFLILFGFQLVTAV